MGWVYEDVEREDFTRQYKDRILLKRMWKFLFPFKRPFIIVSIAIITSSLLAIFAPIILSLTVDIFDKNSQETNILLIGGFIYLIINIASFGTYFVQNYTWGKLIPDFMVNLRVAIFQSFQKQDMKFFDTKQSGNLSNRVGSDASHSADIVSLLSNFSGQILLIILSFFVLFVVSPFLSVIVLFIVPFIIGFTLLFRRLARNASREYRKSEAAVNSSIAEAVEGIQVAKSYGRENEVLEKFQEINLYNYRSGLKQILIMLALFPTLDLFLMISTWMVLEFGGGAAIAGQFGLNGANLYLFIMYLNTFFYPIMNISAFYGQLQSGFASFERILTVLDAEPEVKQNNSIQVNNINGEIQFENVSFYYKENEPVFQNFNLHIRPGEKLAIVGHTGAGKSTIVNLIARFYEFQGGKITIDGIDIRNLELKSYMKQLGIVQQDPFLFAGTVEDNIRYGKFDATNEEIMNVIKAVKVDEVLKFLPDGLNTDVQERGRRLSTGQRQLVCFARALLSNPKILI
ncbi:MAG: ABC transporter ATP-binding protein, partial [Candidatus Thorarchaeota archaeon]